MMVERSTYSNGRPSIEEEGCGTVAWSVHVTCGKVKIVVNSIVRNSHAGRSCLVIAHKIMKKTHFPS